MSEKLGQRILLCKSVQKRKISGRALCSPPFPPFHTDEAPHSTAQQPPPEPDVITTDVLGTEPTLVAPEPPLSAPPANQPLGGSAHAPSSTQVVSPSPPPSRAQRDADLSLPKLRGVFNHTRLDRFYVRQRQFKDFRDWQIV
ncbi:hypothetical protein R3P38DRAFT_2775702 [Favolaschia claudopus]|uniref:Uncharacterized protein n=1 Tax=Favolaschia claudopus TaxID=2862362 RepID=A0AAW0BQV8_9AGAR